MYDFFKNKIDKEKLIKSVLLGILGMILIFCGLYLLFLSADAFAQNSGGDWASSVNDKVSSLESGLTGIAVKIITAVLVGLGIWFVASGRFDWTKILHIIGGVILIASASTFASMFFG